MAVTAGWFGIARATWRRISWALTIVLFLVGLPGLVDGNWGNMTRHAFYHSYVLAWLLLVTHRVRTVSIRDVASLWFIGFFPVVAVVFLLTEPVEQLTGGGNLHTAFWVPLVEEVVKILPLVAWGLLAARRGVRLGMVDLALLGYAVGAGFSFHEDGLWGRTTTGGFDVSFGALFPSFFESGSTFVVAHAGWSMVAGLGVGLLLLHRARNLLTWAGVALVALAVADHMAVNWRGGFGDLLRTLLGQGRLLAGVIILGLIAAVIHDGLALRWVAARDRLFPTIPTRELLSARSDGTDPWQRVLQVHRRLRYLRARNGVYLWLYRVRRPGGSAGDRSAQVAWLTMLGDAAGVRWQPTAATGGGPPAVPATVGAAPPPPAAPPPAAPPAAPTAPASTPAPPRPTAPTTGVPPPAAAPPPPPAAPPPPPPSDTA